MRTISGPRLTLLNGASINNYAMVKVEDGDGTLRDMSNIVGVDFLDSGSLNFNIDQPVATATITFRREGLNSSNVRVSLSPTMTASPANKKADNSYSPLLFAGRRIQVSFNWTVPGAAPSPAEWIMVFDGKIDTVNWSKQTSQATVECRDRGGWLQDTFIEELRTYSDATGTPVETVMQQILNDNPNAKLGAVTLYVPVSPAWNIKAYKQDQVSVLDALKALADQIGWDIRYKWNEGLGVFSLTLFEPARTKTVADWTLGPDQYGDVSDLKQSDANVRNKIRIRSRTVDGTPIVSFAIDSPSVAKFGPRYMEVGDPANIDTQTELDRMADAVLADLRDPVADQEIDNMLYPIVELNDLGQWLANGTHYDTDQKFAVIQIRHEFNATTRRTFIQSRGKVAGQFENWLRLETGDVDLGGVPPGPIIGPVLTENTARGGNGEAAMHVPIKFDVHTQSLLIYSTEAPDGPNPPQAPDIVENRLAATVIRHEGEVASADDWQTEVTISTTTDFQRRIIVHSIGPGGLRGQPFVFSALCEDVGTGPSAAPTGMTATMGDIAGVPKANITWSNNGDNTSEIRLWRNGIILVPRLAPGTTTFEDRGLSPDVVYAYRVQHIRNGQTSEFNDASETPSSGGGLLATPTFNSGYPRGGGFDSQEISPPPNGIVLIQFTNPDPLAYTEIWMNGTTSNTGTFNPIETLGPGETGISLNAANYGAAATNQVRWFYLVATRAGYTDSIPSGHVGANFGV